MMANLIKIIILLFAFVNIFTFVDNGNAECVVCFIIMVGYIIYDLRQSYIRFMYGECTDIHSRRKHKNNNIEWDCWVEWDEWYGDYYINSLMLKQKLVEYEAYKEALTKNAYTKGSLK